MLLSKRSALKNSLNINIKNLWADTNDKCVDPDSLLMFRNLKDALKIVSRDHKNLALNHLIGLSYQGLAIKAVTDNISSKYIEWWAKMTGSLPGYLYNCKKSDSITIANSCKSR